MAAQPILPPRPAPVGVAHPGPPSDVTSGAARTSCRVPSERFGCAAAPFPRQDVSTELRLRSPGGWGTARRGGGETGRSRAGEAGTAGGSARLELLMTAGRRPWVEAPRGGCAPRRERPSAASAGAARLEPPATKAFGCWRRGASRHVRLTVTMQAALPTYGSFPEGAADVGRAMRGGFFLCLFRLEPQKAASKSL